MWQRIVNGLLHKEGNRNIRWTVNDGSGKKEIIKNCFGIVFIGRVLFVTIFIDTILNFSGDFSTHAALSLYIYFFFCFYYEL